jgi:ribosomal protein S27AE
MGIVLHFMPEDVDKPACGAQVFLCSDYTDDRRYVDCGRCKRTKMFKTYDPTRYDVDVWNDEGDVIRWFRRVNAAEVDSIRREYEDNPTVSVVAEECR